MRLLLSVALSAWILVSCTPKKVIPVTDVTAEALANYRVPQINADYAADCRISIKSRVLSQSGSCSIVVTKSGQLRFTLFHPLGGSVLISYIDAELIQFLNRADQVFFQSANTPKNRSKAFVGLFDITPVEFQQVLWGREVTAENGDLEFIYDGDRPSQIIKNDGNQNLKISLVKWKKFGRLEMPRTIIMEDVRRHMRIKLVMTTVEIGEVKADLPLKVVDHCAVKF